MSNGKTFDDGGSPSSWSWFSTTLVILRLLSYSRYPWVIQWPQQAILQQQNHQTATSMNPMVCRSYPIEVKQVSMTSWSPWKLQLNDSLQLNQKHLMLGFGFRCGFWLLHGCYPGTFGAWSSSTLSWQLRLLLIRLTKLTVSLWMSNLWISGPNQDCDYWRNCTVAKANHGTAGVCRSSNGTGFSASVGVSWTMDYIDDNRVNVIYQIPLVEIVLTLISLSLRRVVKCKLWLRIVRVPPI